MGTIHVTSPTPTATPSARVTPTPAALNADEPVVRDFGGTSWTYRPIAHALLMATPRSAWSSPEEQGWERVKHNTRREVWRAELLGKPYYLKYYFRDSWGRRLRRLVKPAEDEAEWSGGLFALRTGIPAVRPVARTADMTCHQRPCALLITEAIEPVQPLAGFWTQMTSDANVARRRRDAAQLTEQLAEMIARAHQAGFEHLDMHANNILVQTIGPRQYRTVFVDLQSARRGVPISDRAVVRNLAQLNQWFRRHSTAGDRLRFLRAYLRWRNEYEHAFEHGRALEHDFPDLVAALAAAAHRHADRLWKQRDRRSLRDGRYFTRLRLPGGWRGFAVKRCKHALPESRASEMEFVRDWWQAALGRPADWFKSGRAATCKQSHSATVARGKLEHGGESVSVILKRPRARNDWRRLVQMLPPSRSMRGWRTGHALLHRDIATARPLAVLERRQGPLVRDSILVTEAIPGAVDLESFLKSRYRRCNSAEWHHLKGELAGLLARQLRQLQERGFRHRDCKASNLLVLSDPGLKLLWIDMDGIRIAAHASGNDTLRPLVRLHVSLLTVPGLTRTDRARFLKAYFSGYGVSPNAWRAVWQPLAAATARKQQQKAARRAWKVRHYGRE